MSKLSINFTEKDAESVEERIAQYCMLYQRDATIKKYCNYEGKYTLELSRGNADIEFEKKNALDVLELVADVYQHVEERIELILNK